MCDEIYNMTSGECSDFQLKKRKISVKIFLSVLPLNDYIQQSGVFILFKSNITRHSKWVGGCCLKTSFQLDHGVYFVLK